MAIVSRISGLKRSPLASEGGPLRCFFFFFCPKPKCPLKLFNSSNRKTPSSFFSLSHLLLLFLIFARDVRQCSCRGIIFDQRTVQSLSIEFDLSAADNAAPTTRGEALKPDKLLLAGAAFEISLASEIKLHFGYNFCVNTFHVSGARGQFIASVSFVALKIQL